MADAAVTRVPCGDAAAGVEVEFLSAGEVSRVPLARGWGVRFDLDCEPVRGFPSFRGQRNFPGLWWFATMARHVGYESWLERDHLIALDADPGIDGVAEQPFWFHWADGVRHAPDFWAHRRDGGVVVLDVRPDDRISPEDAERFSRTADACDAVGWEYRRVGEMDPAALANLRWLAGYRHPRVYRPAIANALESVFRSRKPLLSGAVEVGDPVGVLPVLYHLLWKHRLMVAPGEGGVLTSSTVLVAAA